MKAIVVHEFGGPEVLRVEEIPDPKPGPAEVLVRIRAAGVNPVDTYIRSGKHAVKPTLPRTTIRPPRIPCISPGKGAPILVVHPASSIVAARTESVQRVLHSGRPVLIIDPFAGGQNRVRKQQVDTYFLSYNRTDSADRVQDILTALAFLKTKSNARPQVIGMGDAGVWCLFAAAVAPVPVDLVADLNGFSGTDEDFRERFFVPGIQLGAKWPKGFCAMTPVIGLR